MVNWEDTLEDVASIADEYESAGWETLVLRPGEVQVISGDSVRTGFDVLIPDDEYRELRSVLESGVSFDTYEVHRNVRNDVVHVIVTMEDGATQTGLLYPAYYGLEDADTVEGAGDDGRLRTHLRRLNGEYVELTHSDPDLFVPAID